MSAPLALVYLRRVAAVGIGQQANSLRPLVWPSLAMVRVVSASQYGLAGTTAWWQLIVGGVSGLAAYGGLLYWRKPAALDRALSLIQNNR